jgi:hypothetical protein
MRDPPGLDSGKSSEKFGDCRCIEATQHQRTQDHIASQGAQQIVERRVITQFIGTVCQDEQQRPARRLTGEAPDRRQRCIVRPLRIIERNDQRECARQRKRQFTQTVDLSVTPFLRRHIRQFRQIRQPFPQHRKKIGDLRQCKLRQLTKTMIRYITQQWAQHLADCSKGQPLIQRRSAQFKRKCTPLSGSAQRFCYQARLPDPCFTNDGDNTAAAPIKIGEPAAQ